VRRLRQTQVSARDHWFVRFLKVMFICGRGFFADKISLRASALTFYTLIAIVPVLSLFLGISAGFGLRENLVSWLQENFSQQQELLEFLLNFANSMLSSAKGGVFTGINVLFLLWSVLNLLNNIEISFNHIWQVRQNRSWMRKFTDYLSVLLIAPVFLIVSSSIAVALQGQVAATAAQWGVYSYAAPVVKFGFKALGLVLVWLMFTFLYVAMPYTKVKFVAALTAGIVAGTLFQIVQNFYVYSQIMTAKYNAVYGSFAAIPLFLLWTQMSWLILLFGAKLSFAVQNVTHADSQSFYCLRPRRRRQLTLLVAHHIVKTFHRCEKAQTTYEISQHLDIPTQMTCEIISELLTCGIVSEVITDKAQENSYQPAIDIQAISIGEVMERLDKIGSDYPCIAAEHSLQQVLSPLSDAAITEAKKVKLVSVAD
jgi:membrane protein